MYEITLLLAFRHKRQWALHYSWNDSTFVWLYDFSYGFVQPVMNILRLKKQALFPSRTLSHCLSRSRVMTIMAGFTRYPLLLKEKSLCSQVTFSMCLQRAKEQNLKCEAEMIWKKLTPDLLTTHPHLPWSKKKENKENIILRKFLFSDFQTTFCTHVTFPWWFIIIYYNVVLCIFQWKLCIFLYLIY